MRLSCQTQLPTRLDCPMVTPACGGRMAHGLVPVVKRGSQMIPDSWADAYLDVLDHDSRAHNRDDAWTWDSPHALLVNLPLKRAREQLVRQRSWWLP